MHLHRANALGRVDQTSWFGARGPRCTSEVCRILTDRRARRTGVGESVGKGSGTGPEFGRGAGKTQDRASHRARPPSSSTATGVPGFKEDASTPGTNERTTTPTSSSRADTIVAAP